MKIGLFGGSFNPIHRQHLAIALAACEQACLDEVWLLPVYQPVHKHDSELLPYDLRRMMVQAAIKQYPRLRLSDLERDLGGPSYTIRLVRYCQHTYPEHSFYLIIGADSLQHLLEWHEGNFLTKCVPFLVAYRPGVDQTHSLPNPESRWLNIQPDPVSSHEIRASLGRGRCKHLPVPPAVMALIVEYDMYSCLGVKFSSWLSNIRDYINRHTHAKEIMPHLQGVARLAAEYAAELKLDPRHGYMAGLAHDLFRLADPSILISWAKKFPVQLSELESKIPMLAHGKAAAAYLSTLQPRVPSAIIEAVLRHTFPHNRMAPLARALVLADALEPGRDQPELDAIRNAPDSLEQKFRLIIEYKRNRAQQHIKAKSSKVCSNNCNDSIWSNTHE